MNHHTPDGRAPEVADQLRDAPADIGALRGRLATEAAREGLVDVAYRVADSPIGGLLLAATSDGLVYVAFEVENGADVLEMLARRIGPGVLRIPAAAAVARAVSPAGEAQPETEPVSPAGAVQPETVPESPSGAAQPETVPESQSAGPTLASVLDAAEAQLSEYFAGHRRDFDLPLDTRLATGFRGQVQRHLADIAYGATATYKQFAADLDRPGAVRAVGTACATNPLPLVWPCHRILRSDGGLGGYRGGVEAKQRLLEMESAA